MSVDPCEPNDQLSAIIPFAILVVIFPVTIPVGIVTVLMVAASFLGFDLKHITLGIKEHFELGSTIGAFELDLPQGLTVVFSLEARNLGWLARLDLDCILSRRTGGHPVKAG